MAWHEALFSLFGSPWHKKVAIALLVLSCSDTTSGDPVPVAIAWRFADGRNCDTSGVSIVAISSAEASTFLSTCTQGFGRALNFASLTPGKQLVELEGRTSENTVLYRASLSFTLEAGIPRELDASFIFEGGP
jgi:hypothetical protein